jgi:YVTN family beta-propeller protein
MPLQLLYDFTPSPNPITASVAGSNPNVIDLQVMISNPTIDPIQLTSISITIPGGQEGANTLSDSANLPNPDYDTSSGWSGSTSGDTVTFNLPASGIADSFIFTLPGIQVNETPGIVPITIVEDGPPKVIDDTTYSLVKQPSDFPITNFYAQPATLINLDETVTLFWNCSAQGAEYSYSVHSDSWQPDDCLNGGQCYTCTDGTIGIQTDPFAQTTTFALDVIQTNADGSRTIYQTLETVVRVLAPSVSGNSYAETFLSGRVARLHWLAFNAAYCTVEVDGQIIDSNAPIDTFAEGYWVIPAGTQYGAEGGLHQVTVTAHAASGLPQFDHSFPDIYVDPIVTIPTGQIASGVIAITPDGTKALVPIVGAMAVIEIANSTVSSTINVSDTPASVTVTPDGKFALVPTNGTTGNLIMIDLATLSIAAGPQPIDNWSGGIAITPDGTLALVSGEDVFSNSVLTVIYLPGMAVDTQTIAVGKGAGAVAITPDGTLALTANYFDNTVTVVDIASGSATATIAVGTQPQAIAITPDGTIALTANTVDNTVSLIDLASQSVVATLPVGNGPQSVAVLATPPDGALGLVGNYADATLMFIDIANRVVLPTGIYSGYGPEGLAVMPDGSHILITNGTTNSVTKV